MISAMSELSSVSPANEDDPATATGPRRSTRAKVKIFLLLSI